MTRVLTWLIGVVAVLVLLAIAAVLALPPLINTGRVQALLASTASQALGRPVTFESVSVSIFPLPSIKLHRLEIAEDPRFGSTPFLRLETGRLALKLRPLFSGRVEFGDLTLQRPAIVVIRNAEGVLNVATLGAPAAGRPAPRGGRGAPTPGGAPVGALPGRVRIEHGTVTYQMQGAGGAASRYRVEGLDLAVSATGGALTFAGRARVTPGDLGVSLTDGRVALAGARGLLEAPLSARVVVDGKDIADLVAAAAGPATAVAGPLTGAFTVSGTVGAPTAVGTLAMAHTSVTRVVPACPEPKRRTLTLDGLSLADVTWAGRRLASRPVATELAGGRITAGLVATLERGVHVRLDALAIRALPLERVLVDFLCQGYALAGPLDLDGTLAFATPDLWGTLSGAGSLKIGAGRVVGAQALALIGNVVRVGGAVSSLLRADVPASLTSSPVEFDSITGTYRITNGVVSTRDLVYASRAMTVTVVGDYALVGGRMNLDMLVNHGRGEVKARVTGTAASPSIRVDPSTLVRDVDRQKVESGLKDLLKRFR